MADVTDFQPGGFRFIPGVFQYSAGVAALPGLRILRVRLADPVPLDQGFARIEGHLRAAGRPTTAFCACELRSPEPFTDDGFRAFNRLYCGTLERWGLMRGEQNPVARANVCPQHDMPGRAKPAGPALHAFCYTVPDPGAAASFVIAGSGEAREGGATYRDSTTAWRDLSPAGMLAKARFVLNEMERRMAALGFGWADTTGVQVYTVHDIHPFLADELVARGAARHGLTWHFCRPPVIDLEFEMDCRGVAEECVI